MKTLVFGAGPTGSLYAARLFEAGHDITLLDRGQRLEDLRTHGVVLDDAFSGRREVHHIPLVEEFGEDDDYDLVMVVMRKNQAPQLLPLLAKNRRVGTFLFLMNNAADLNGERFARTRDAIILGLRALKEAMRAQRAAGIPVRPPTFRAVNLVPEAFMVAMMRPVAKTDLYKAGIIGHARAARDEISHLLDEFRDRVAPGGVAMPAFETLARYSIFG